MNATVLTVLCLILLAAVLILSIRLFKVKKQMIKAGIILDEIEKGNLNRRILARKGDMTAELCYKINKIVMNSEREIASLKKIEKTNRQLMTSLSHDVRTPLTSLIGYLDVLNSEKTEAEEGKRYLGIVWSKAYDLKDYVDVLFDWFKLESREYPFSFEEQDICELTRNGLIDWIPLFEENNLDYTVHIPDEEYQVRLDTRSWNRILNNLVQNAVKHSGCSSLEIGIERCENSVMLWVKDNGSGIAPDQLPHIFERLYKCDSSRSGAGSGLGLAITKELVQANGGTIQADSVLYQGTVFTVVLPLC
ncbi:Signal transduction histidine kinase [Eubacterium maltosivorans]|uniref:sensor histidine kinase n=1 Tax=Eubacterium maltosivorans TaxID=2041044 RepID=UPI000882A148|nr:HAMP domain-containing sensor histidine kinase [Eubacterium maltosivorans]WPK80163.1 Adaptive-response sensory-kinase SasA [Eubacterium maltosivorans]SDO82930.1 Signal transduction histidine kinase [Eubacterium maltosivorans]